MTVVLSVSLSDLIALFDVLFTLFAPAEICPELIITTLFALPEFSVTVIVFVLLFIMYSCVESMLS